ncbi:MAG: DUF1998 domain-containing protein [Lachnospiraceae bacterium]|nr:DUF1998 domain-containing protein [Lachnospiraceae bacterium]
MRFGGKDDKKVKMKSVGKLRKNQMITTFGPGSISEMPEYTVIMAATDYWSNYSPIIYEPTLKRLNRGISYFKEPYASESDSSKGNPDVPAFRFPRMHFCPSCGKLDDYKAFGDPKNKKCMSCNSELVPSRFVSACINGHLEDFPFEWWVHFGNVASCSDPENHHKLEIKFRNDTGGLSSIMIKCTKCGQVRSMEGCMSKDALKGHKCRGRRPWIGFKTETNDPEECMAILRTIQRGASNAFFSITESALTIPPWSTKIHTLLGKEWEKIKTALDNNMDEAFLRQFLGILFKDCIESGQYTVDDFLNEIKRSNDDTDEENYTEQMMFEDEYKALCAGYSSDEEGEPEQFLAEVTDVSDALEEYIDEVVLVKRLREVIAFKGFRRIEPAPPEGEDKEKEGANSREFMPPWNKAQCWLPAAEMRGEGIFIKLNEERLKEWEENNSERYSEMGKRNTVKIGKGMYSPRYVLLHTLSHLLIRQLTIDCGYQEAAIKERIYSTYPESENSMCGILIYTSASDSDGSLGGLVRQGECDLLEETIRNALQEASWCSSDPLCIESKAQGFYSLNYAACHACALLPETSCVARNCLLDRASVVGKPDNRRIGFFGDLLGG